MMICICEKIEVTPIKKNKTFNNSLNIAHIWEKKFPEPHTYLYNTLHKSHDFFIYCFESRHIFQKMWLFEKNHHSVSLGTDPSQANHNAAIFFVSQGTEKFSKSLQGGQQTNKNKSKK